MLGRAGAISVLAQRFETALPLKSQELRKRLDADEETIPDFAKIVANQDGPSGGDNWPILEIVDGQDRAWEDFDSTPAGPTWVVPYGVTLYLWVMGYGEAHTALVRRHMTTAVHEVLAAKQQITDEVRILPQTIRTSPSELASADSSAFLAGMRIELVLRVQESLRLTTTLIDEITTDTTVIPPA